MEGIISFVGKSSTSSKKRSGFGFELERNSTAGKHL